MKLFDVYPRYDLNIVRGEDVWVFDSEENRYLDLYGGHAVISIGHGHPHYLQRIKTQLEMLGFYSNSVRMDIQEEYAEKLCHTSGYNDYQVFLCNSGAEANENALKVASFATGRSKVIVFEKAFHGRTSLAVEATDNPSLHSAMNHTGNVVRLPFDDIESVKASLNDDVAAVLLEGIQGIAGIYEPNTIFLKQLEKVTHENGSLLIVDEIQSGFGRTGKFFAHQHAGIAADIISMAKGMGNGFPLGGILISDQIKSKHGMLGSTFGGNPLACAAGLAVLEVFEKEQLIVNADNMGEQLLAKLKGIQEIQEVRGRGLMLGIDLSVPARDIRSRMLFESKIFTGSASNLNTIRILPPITLKEDHINSFITSLSKTLSDESISVSP